MVTPSWIDVQSIYRYSHAGGEVVSAGGSRLLLLPPDTSSNTRLKVSSRRPAHTAPSYFILRHCATISFVHFSVHFCPFSFHQVFGISKLQRGNTDHHCPASGETKVECHRGLEIQCEFDCFLCLFNCTCLYNVQTHVTCAPVGSMKYPVQAARLQIVSSSPASVATLAPRRCRDLMRAMRPAATIPTLTSAQQLSGRRGKWNYEFWISVERRYYAPLASCSISYII